MNRLWRSCAEWWAAARYILLADDCQSFMFGEVAEVFEIQGSEWYAVRETARGNPGVICGAGLASAGCTCGDAAPGPRDGSIAVHDVLAEQPSVQAFAAVRSPLPFFNPADQFRQGHECDHWPRTDQVRRHLRGQLALDDQRGYVGVEYNGLHGSDDIGTPGRVGGGQEVVQLFV